MFTAKDKYFLNDLQFDRVKLKHRHLFKSFETFQADLKAFLIEDAVQSQDMCVSNTYLVFDQKNFRAWKQKKEELQLLGYITVLNDSIRLDGQLKEQFREKGIIYKSLPALKIGRLCVDDKYQGRGIGKTMLLWVIHRVVHLNQNTACRFITLDAKRHHDSQKDSLHFYKKFNFKVLKTKEKNESEIFKQTSGSTPMYIDLYPVIKIFKAKLNF